MLLGVMRIPGLPFRKMKSVHRKPFWKRIKWRLLTLIASLGSFAGVFVLNLHPVNSTLLKLTMLGLIGGAWLGATVLSWQRNTLRRIALSLPLLAIIPFLLPGRDIDANELRNDYVNRVSQFEGTKYFWGGESPRGIDCSGLPRRAFRDALLSYGFRSGNGRAFRGWAEQWWFDASADALGEGYRDYTKPIGGGSSIREMEYSKLIPGDLAVTKGGVHILVYAGEGRWSQADPGTGAVVTLDGKGDRNGWFEIPVTTHRWTMISPE